jgi:hypothetical protein
LGAVGDYTLVSVVYALCVLPRLASMTRTKLDTIQFFIVGMMGWRPRRTLLGNVAR